MCIHDVTSLEEKSVIWMYHMTIFKWKICIQQSHDPFWQSKQKQQQKKNTNKTHTTIVLFMNPYYN